MKINFGKIQQRKNAVWTTRMVELGETWFRRLLSTVQKEQLKKEGAENE